LQIKTETRVGIFVLIALAIFVYMGFTIGVFRFDLANYRKYVVYFKDVSGLSIKADVKIAGVKVGFVEAIDLVDGDQAKATVMVHKRYALYQDAYAVVRQDGLLGVKYLEVVVGDPLLPNLNAGDTLSRPSKAPVSVDELMAKFKTIADNVADVTDSFREVMGTPEGKEQMRVMMQNFNQTAERLSSFAQTIDRVLIKNEDQLTALLSVGQDIHRLSDKLENDILPSIKSSIENISHAFDRDLDKLASRFGSTAEALEEASNQAREGLRSIGSVAEKIDEGKGTIGKLINEEDTYRDLKVAVQGLRNYFAKVDSLQIVFDTHGENMYRPTEYLEYEDSKGYFDIRIHPQEDYFYLVQIATSIKGYVDRQELFKQYFNNENYEYDTSHMNLSDRDKLRFAPRKRIELIKRNAVRFGFQFGKIFNDIAFRFGLFEGSAGVGVDFDIPFRTDKFRWVTSLEMFDFKGQDRLFTDKDRVADTRPHLKWINKVFMMRNLYVTFGADDFISRHNMNAFFGAGLRFGDDDVKYFLPSLGGAASIAR
jgi:phospholipid/cholesterol/gamma-HCH transport system substrate-binding protein